MPHIWDWDGKRMSIISKRMSIIVASLLIIIFMLTMCSSYQSEDNLIGKYASLSNTNTYDTISLLRERRYERHIYGKSNNFIKKFEGSWSFNSEGKIVFADFFMNLDRDLVKFPELLNETYGHFEISINKNSQGLYFCTGYEDDYCYQKVSN